MSEIANYIYNNFYVNNCFKMYLFAAFFLGMPLVAAIDFGMSNMNSENLERRQIYHN